MDLPESDFFDVRVGRVERWPRATATTLAFVDKRYAPSEESTLSLGKPDTVRPEMRSHKMVIAEHLLLLA